MDRSCDTEVVIKRGVQVINNRIAGSGDWEKVEADDKHLMDLIIDYLTTINQDFDDEPKEFLLEVEPSHYKL